MKGLLYKDISIMTRSFKGNILLLVALFVLAPYENFVYFSLATTALGVAFLLAGALILVTAAVKPLGALVQRLLGGVK